jgi:hypothetical protein
MNERTTGQSREALRVEAPHFGIWFRLATRSVLGLCCILVAPRLLTLSIMRLIGGPSVWPAP